ncbi:hypothetical protein CCP4SC76_3060004 [Gammaproteobacteria bacterium]
MGKKHDIPPRSDRAFLSEIELANRWSLAPATFRYWRIKKTGPVFVKFGGSVRYPLNGPGGILDFETKNRHRTITEPVTTGQTITTEPTA